MYNVYTSTVLCNNENTDEQKRTVHLEVPTIIFEEQRCSRNQKVVHLPSVMVRFSKEFKNMDQLDHTLDAKPNSLTRKLTMCVKNEEGDFLYTVDPVQEKKKFRLNLVKQWMCLFPFPTVTSYFKSGKESQCYFEILLAEVGDLLNFLKR